MRAGDNSWFVGEKKQEKNYIWLSRRDLLEGLKVIFTRYGFVRNIIYSFDSDWHLELFFCERKFLSGKLIDEKGGGGMYRKGVLR